MSILTSKQIAARLDALEAAARQTVSIPTLRSLAGRLDALEALAKHAGSPPALDPEAPAKPKRKRARR